MQDDYSAAAWNGPRSLSEIAASASSSTAKSALTWANRSLRDLLYVIAMQMPLRAPGSLSDGEGFDLLAFILRKNEYSSGPVPLDASQAYALLFEGGAAPAAAQSDAPSLDLPGPATLYSRAPPLAADGS